MYRVVTAWCLLMGISLPAAEFHHPDETKVRKVITDFADARDRHDAKALAALHTEDVNFINIFGEWWKTSPEVERNLARIHSEGGGMAHSTSGRKRLYPGYRQTARQVAHRQFPEY